MWVLYVPFWYQPPVPTPEEPPKDPAFLQAEGEPDKIVRFRREQLEKSGLPYPLALELALVGVDWHRVVEAVSAGATDEQVEAMFL